MSLFNFNYKACLFRAFFRCRQCAKSTFLHYLTHDCEKKERNACRNGETDIFLQWFQK